MSERQSAMVHRIKTGVTAASYLNSEHIVRYLTTRLFTVEELETVLLTGRIIETHRHPLRPDAFLVLGYAGQGPVHVMCANDSEENLVVLYAYRPGPPLWKDDRTRAGKNSQMNANQKRCFFCNGDIEPVTVGNFDFRGEGGLYVIKNVPAGLCIQCGEKYISVHTSGNILKKIEKQDIKDTDRVLVYEYGGR